MTNPKADNTILPVRSMAEDIAGKLSPLEIDLLCGRCEGWGSWMFTAGGFMVSLGLGRKENGSIFFDTPLADEVRDHLASLGDDDVR